MLNSEQFKKLGQLPEYIHRQNGGALMNLSTGSIPSHLSFDKDYVVIPVEGELFKSWVYPSGTDLQRLLRNNGVSKNGDSFITQINEIVSDYDQQLKPITEEVSQNNIWTPAQQNFSFDLLSQRQNEIKDTLEDAKIREVGPPGLGESFIPVWGSGRAALNDFQRAMNNWGQADNINQWGSATFNTAMLGADIATAGSLARPIANFGKNVMIKHGARIFPELIKESPIRVTQFYKTAEEFANDTKNIEKIFMDPQQTQQALLTPKVPRWRDLSAQPNSIEAIGEKFLDAPWWGQSEAKTYVSPFEVNKMSDIERGLSGVGDRTHYVEFDALPSELNSTEGIKRGLGLFQNYIPNEVVLQNRNPTFGVINPVNPYVWGVKIGAPPVFSVWGRILNNSDLFQEKK